MEEDNIENKKNKKHMSERTQNIVEWIVCIVIAIVLTLLFRYFIATPTVVQQVSMYPTLQENQRLIVKRTFRITHKMPERGDIITFEAPTHTYSAGTADESNPVAVYMENDRNIFSSFSYSSFFLFWIVFFLYIFFKSFRNIATFVFIIFIIIK